MTRRRPSGSNVGKSPCRLTTTSCARSGSSSARAACTRSDPTAAPDRSAPRGRRRPGPPLAISGSPQATATGPIPACLPHSSICTIIGLPPMSASGLPGRRVEAMRAGITMIGFKVGVRVHRGVPWRCPFEAPPPAASRPAMAARRWVEEAISFPYGAASLRTRSSPCNGRRAGSSASVQPGPLRLIRSGSFAAWTAWKSTRA